MSHDCAGERRQRGSPVDGDELLGGAVLSRRGQLPAEGRSEWRARRRHRHRYITFALTRATDLEPRARVSGAYVTWLQQFSQHSVCVCVCVCALKKSAPRRKCAACRIVVHTGCMEQLEQVGRPRHHLPPRIVEG